jgi:hypothetical protein
MDIDLQWWIVAIEIPVISALFWMIWSGRREIETHLRNAHDEIAEHKLEVAKTYARLADLQMLENRLTAHLLRIEAKLDVTALKTESLIHERKNL